MNQKQHVHHGSEHHSSSVAPNQLPQSLHFGADDRRSAQMNGATKNCYQIQHHQEMRHPRCKPHENYEQRLPNSAYLNYCAKSGPGQH
eukprot:9670033-Karenia_brevis.AAC.1